MGYSVENLQMSMRSKFTLSQNRNQEASIFPGLACSSRRGNLEQRPLFYADGLRSWVTITMPPDQDVWAAGDLTTGTYVVHNVRRKPPSLGGSFRSAHLAFRSCFVSPGWQLRRPVFEGRRTSGCTALSIRFGRRNVQRKRHVHPTGGKHSGVCLLGNIVVSPVAPMRTNGIGVGGDSLRGSGASLRTCRTFALSRALLGGGRTKVWGRT